MKIILFIIVATFAVAQTDKCDRSQTQNANKPVVGKTINDNEKSETKFDRLPDGIQSSDLVRKEVTDSKGEVTSIITITVEEALKELDAKYAGDKLTDRSGREIRFYTPPARGMSQGLEEDTRQRKEDEKNLADLKKKYTVIVLYIDPRKVS
jgi:hypothetical protein